MWPFRKKPDEPDTREANGAARAIAASLRTEPERWKVGQYTTQLLHDSQIMVDTDGWIRQPNLDDEPEANAEVVKAAIVDWIASRIALPKPVEPKPAEAVKA
jgi:hypothetical protein